jgi:antirestriction protein ArdC
MQKKAYENITNKILESLEKGRAPWNKPFVNHSNFITKKPYRGINYLSTISSDFNCPYWLTFKQVEFLKGKVKKGEKGTPIHFFKIENKEADEGEVSENSKVNFISIFSYVFNLEQIEGIEWQDESFKEEIQGADEIIKNYKNSPEIVSDCSDKAFYAPLQDYINCPKPSFYKTKEEYYSTLFHELIHSTGHQTRLDRKELSTNAFYGSHDYSLEELVAEIGSTFLCHEAGILDKTYNNSENYIKGWFYALKNDPKMIVVASQRAIKAAEYILKQ